MKSLGPLESLYGDLKDDRSFRRLIDDAAKLVELHFFPWEPTLDRREVFERTAARNLYCVKAAFYEQYRRFKGVKRWGCKSTFMVRYYAQARKYSPGARFIHLVRDGRDVAVSARGSVFNHFHPYYVARLWTLQQRLALEMERILGPEEFLTLRYEDLITDPERAARNVCRFLGEEYEPAMLRYFEQAEPKKLAGASASWENCARPVLGGNSGKYKAALTPAEIRLFETVSFRELERFGYPLENPRGELEAASARPFPALFRALYYVLEKGKMSYVRTRALFTDRNAFAMLGKRLFLARVKARLLCRL